MVFENCYEISFAKAKKQFSWDALLHTVKFDKTKSVLVCDGALTIKGDLDLDVLSQTYAAFVIGGDLAVTGSIVNLKDKSPFLLRVLGKTTAKNIFVGGARVELWRDVSVANLVFPHSSHGHLKVLSPIKAKIIIRTLMNADFEGAMKGQYLNLAKSPEQLTLISKNVMSKKTVDPAKMLEAIQKKQSILA